MAVKRWVGAALPVSQVQRMTFAGTYVAGDLITITVNGKAIVVTVGSAVDVVTIATIVAYAINGSDIQADESRTGSGPDIPEFAEIIGNDPFTAVTANVGANGRVTITGPPGIPFTITVTENSASGTVTNSVITQATGPNHWNNAANWSPSGEPINGDEIVFDSGNVDVLYGLNTGGLIPDSVMITKGYSGNIGLPIKRNAGLPEEYHEYRDRYLILGASGTAIPLEIGRGDGAGSSRINIDFSTHNFTATILDTGPSITTDEPVVALKGGNTASILRVHGGNVGVAYFADESAHLATVTIGSAAGSFSTARVTIGETCDVLDATITVNGGALLLHSATTSGSGITINGGEAVIVRGNQIVVNAFGGSAIYNGVGTIATFTGRGGTLDLSQGVGTVTITNSTIYRGTTIRDPFKRRSLTNPMTVNADARDVNLEFGSSFTIAS